MKKTVIIKNKFRFITFVTIMVLMLSMAAGALFPVSAASPSGIRYTEVQVQSGDTLWQLARTYGQAGKDVREVIYDICRLNDTDAASIYPGQMLKIPY